MYLYRAVDSTGTTIDFLLSTKRDAVAAECFLTKVFGREEPSRAVGRVPRESAFSLLLGNSASAADHLSSAQIFASTYKLATLPVVLSFCAVNRPKPRSETPKLSAIVD
jgi:hypothetical protein